MNCHEARERFAELLGGEIGLTEWATVEAHVGQCAECGDVLDQLYRTAPKGHTRRPAAFAEVPGRSGRRGGLSRLTGWAAATAVLVLVIGLGLFAIERRYEVWLAGLRSVLPSLSESGSSGRDGRAQAAPQEPLASPGGASTVEPQPEVATPAAAPPASRVRPEPAAQPASPAKAWGTTEAGPVKRAVPARAAKPEPAAESASPTAASSTDVVIQLSVQDRREAERHVKTLIARLGGTRRGREQAATMMLVVPRAKYGELTRGLAQIGAWQMESDAGALPDPVRVAVRLAR